MAPLSTILSLGLSAAAVYASPQYGDDSSDSTATMSSSSAMSTSASGNQIIKVGQDGLTFEPDTLTVEEGDMVEFHFWPMNHSVSMSTFDEPCVPASDDAFWSGFMPVEEGMGDDIFVVQINSTDPIWFYCATGRHCENGMVGVINPPSSGNTLDDYRDAAADVDASEWPSQIQGGVVMAAADTESGSPTESGSASSTESAASETSSGAAISGYTASSGLVGFFAGLAAFAMV